MGKPLYLSECYFQKILRHFHRLLVLFWNRYTYYRCCGNRKKPFNRTFHHHEITTITMATYTFTAFTMAVINMVKYRKYNSPVYSASKAISLAAASVSMLTLESTMLTTFDDGNTDALTRKILLGATGGVVSVFIIIMAIYMIVQSTKKLKAFKL